MDNADLILSGARLTMDNSAFAAGGATDVSLKSLSGDSGGSVVLGSQTLTLGTNNGTGGVFAGTISGAGQLTKTGSGTQTLSGGTPNTYTGVTTINDGTLVLQKTAGVNAIAGNITIGNASGTDVLRLAASDQIADTSVISFTSGGAGNSAKLELNGYLETVAGIQTTSANQAAVIQNTESGGPAGSNNPAILTVNNSADYAYDGLIRNGGGGSLGLTKLGGGTLTLRDGFASNQTNYTGAATVTAGKLVIDNLSAFASPITVNSTAADGLTLNQGTNSLNLGVTISGSGNVTKTGAGTLTLSNTANTYSGVTTFAGGIVNVASVANYGANSSLGNRASDSSPGNVGLLFRGGTLQYTGSTAQSTNRAVRISTTGGGTIDASGSNPAATLSFTAASSPDFFENRGNRTLTLTGSNAGANTFAMLIGQAGGQTTLSKTGPGTWYLTNTGNTYTGETILGGGVLNVASVADYGVASSIGART